MREQLKKLKPKAAGACANCLPRGLWDCSLFAKPDIDPEQAGVDASGRDRPRS
jgi:hypothetical protein